MWNKSSSDTTVVAELVSLAAPRLLVISCISSSSCSGIPEQFDAVASRFPHSYKEADWLWNTKTDWKHSARSLCAIFYPWSLSIPDWVGPIFEIFNLASGRCARQRKGCIEMNLFFCEINQITLLSTKESLVRLQGQYLPMNVYHAIQWQQLLPLIGQPKVLGLCQHDEWFH